MVIREISLAVLTCALVAVSSQIARATADEAWEALHRLDAARAIPLFEEARKETPSDHALIRGLILAYHIDGRYGPQVQLMREALKIDPANPYNLALFEHMAANFDSYAQNLQLHREFAEHLMKLPPGPIQFCGKCIALSASEKTLNRLPDDFDRLVGVPPAAWVSGPYENGSRVCAVRSLPGETEPLDTSAILWGKEGTRLSWVYLKTNVSGDFAAGQAIENQSDGAIQMRVPFRLGSARDIIVVLGGIFHYRLRLDGSFVFEDRSVRNAVIRDAVRLSVPAGDHEITLTMGWQEAAGDFRVLLLDTLYQPISDLTWLTYTRPDRESSVTARAVNPIFDPFESYAAQVGEAPDTRYWRSVLQMYNAHQSDAVRTLEDLNARKELSLLEVLALYQALLANEESEQANVHLGYLAEQVSTPLTDLLWSSESGESYEAMLRKAVALSEKFPNRPDIEAIAALVPLLTGNMQGLFENAEAYRKKYPDQLSLDALVVLLYSDVFEDHEAALDAFLNICERREDKRAELLEGPAYYAAAKKHDKELACARQALELLPPSDQVVARFAAAALAAGKPEGALVVLDSLLELYPTNLELLNLIHAIGIRTNQHERARQALEKIHRRKPTAHMPYKQLDSLHNFTPYDSIFTPFDVMALWGDPPPEEQLNGLGSYTLCDRREVIIFESGLALNDVQLVRVLLDRTSVEAYQETGIGFSPESDAADLLVARRLRKGQPPLAGEHRDFSIYFQDLKPGDAIELHYRLWEQQGGDLWQQYWDEYQVAAASFQQRWRYSILTNRSDCNFATTCHGLEPVVDTHCNYVRTTWQQENTPAVDGDLALTPPAGDLAGKIFVSTLSDWNVLGNWYAGISKAILDDNPRAAGLADEIARNSPNDTETLHRLYNRVVSDIPYQVMPFKYSASVPHTPDEVLIDHWGDCKDKGHLLIAMLREAGIPSWPILVMTRSEGSSLPIPYFGFDHLVVGCVIDGDTVFVDPTDTPFPPEFSLRRDVCGQPCLHILPDGASLQNQLPPLKAEDWQENWVLTLKQGAGRGAFRFELARNFSNQLAGYRRASYRDETPHDIMKSRESYYADTWSIALTVDSLTLDSTATTSPRFSDQLFGTMTPSAQQLGTSMIIQLPQWSPFRNSLPTDLFGRGKRPFPVDLRSHAGDAHYVLKLEVPDGYGDPQVAEAARYSQPHLNFTYDYSFDEETRTLTLTYHILIEDGQVDAGQFRDFVETVLETFNTPVLVKRRT